MLTMRFADVWSSDTFLNVSAVNFELTGLLFEADAKGDAVVYLSLCMVERQNGLSFSGSWLPRSIARI
jgi:hypothetical protein